MVDLIKTAYGADTSNVIGGPVVAGLGPLRCARQGSVLDAAENADVDAPDSAGGTLQAQGPER
jgi:hypothetical protein